MRLFLLPISTRRTLIYCERTAPTTTPDGKLPLTERIIDRASTTWTQWERAEKGWQKKLTTYGNQVFNRIPFEEWGLKSIPPATKKRIEDVDSGRVKFECLYPGRFLDGSRVKDVLQTLATERQSLHSKRLWTSILWMPITIPFTIVPVIPNIPFFYLCFRAYSHYRALNGGRLLEHLLKHDLITTTSSDKMNENYAAGLLHPSREKRQASEPPTKEQIDEVVKTVHDQKAAHPAGESMLLQRWNGKLLAEAFHLPEMEIEVERAVEQVEKKLAETTASAADATSGTESKSEDVATTIAAIKEEEKSSR